MAQATYLLAFLNYYTKQRSQRKGFVYRARGAMNPQEQDQATRFYELLSGLSRAYQYRDRLGAGKYGISVAEWYPLEVVAGANSITIGDLARELHLDMSTLSRIVNRLEEAGWVRRIRDEADRRVWWLSLTSAGKRKVARVRSQLISEYQGILEAAPCAARPAILKFLRDILRALRVRELEEEAGLSAKLPSSRGS